MKLSLAYIMLILAAAVAVGTAVGVLDYRASLNSPLRPSEASQTTTQESCNR